MEELVISEKAKKQAESCRFCWMCRHLCPIGNATGQERNTARARALGVSMVVRGTYDLSTIADNVYECGVCGACTNNCVTGWDPKIFIQEVKAELALKGLLPEYIKTILETYASTGNAYGAKAPEGYKDTKGDVLFVLGQDAFYRSEASYKGAVALMDKIGASYALNEKANDTGATLNFLVGKTKETEDAAAACAKIMNEYKEVVVYDPVDMRFIAHEWKEWGIEVTAKVVSFNDYVKANMGKLKVAKGKNVYTPQDNYAYARDLDDTETVREILGQVGEVKDMLLNRKEANMAGSLLMDLYMHDVQMQVARDRWFNAAAMDCKVIVTENPAEYELLKATEPEGSRVMTLEEAILENAK
ncbi:MAG: (Fe-S)-binding protein [Bacilli bacterium]|nr:(Fe-S)-binding protein [Bacilli bacterium]